MSARLGGSNVLLSAQDLGQHLNFRHLISGTVGAEVGAATRFYKITSLQPARIIVSKRDIPGVLDRYVRVGLLDEARNPVPLRSDGVAIAAGLEDPGGTTPKAPAGSYYISVASDRWQAAPFEVLITLEGIGELKGAATGALSALLTIQRTLLAGISSGNLLPSGSLQDAALVKSLAGVSTGALEAALTLSIPRGAAVLTAAPYATLRQDLRLEGIATGALNPVLTLSATKLIAIATGRLINRASIAVRRSSGYDY